MRLSDFNPMQSSSLIAAEAVAYKDLIYADGYDGKGRKASVSNFAAVGNVNYGSPMASVSTGQIVAQTSLTSAQTQAYNRQAVVSGDKGEIIALFNALVVNKFYPDGSLAADITLSSGPGWVNHHILKLANGNIACLAKDASGIQFVVLDQNLSVIKSLTTIPSSIKSYFSAISLSGGGFAVVFHDSSSALISRFATYDNSGNAVLSPTTIWTRTGTVGEQYHKMIQLSNGNIAIAVSSTNTVSSIGLFYGVINSSGSIVSAFALLDSTSNAIIPEIAVISGYFTISRPNGTNQKAYVFNNAGAQQGADITLPTSDGGLNTTKLLSDGTYFWLIWQRNSDSKCILIRILSSGTTDKSIPVPGTYNLYLDAFYENGVICVLAYATGSTRPFIIVFSIQDLLFISSTLTYLGVAPSTSTGNYPRIIPGGDRSFVAMYDYASPQATNFFVGKYMKTAVIGPAQNSAAVNTAVKMISAPGSYDINAISGGVTRFDHTGNSLVGNKGSISNSSVSLLGMGV